MAEQAVVVISEDPAVRRGLAELVRAGGLGEAFVFNLPRTFVEQYDAATCGCILLDLRVSAYEAIRLLKHQQKVQCRMSLVYFTVIGCIPVAVENDITGCELKTFSGPEPGEDMLARVREAMRRQQTLCAESASKARLRLLYEHTSPRERQVLERLARGYTSKEIAAELDLSPRTVGIYRSRLQLKLHAESTAELVRMWTTIVADQGRQGRQGAATGPR